MPEHEINHVFRLDKREVEDILIAHLADRVADLDAKHPTIEWETAIEYDGDNEEEAVIEGVSITWTVQESLKTPETPEEESVPPLNIDPPTRGVEEGPLDVDINVDFEEEQEDTDPEESPPEPTPSFEGYAQGSYEASAAEVDTDPEEPTAWQDKMAFRVATPEEIAGPPGDQADEDQAKLETGSGFGGPTQAVADAYDASALTEEEGTDKGAFSKGVRGKIRGKTPIQLTPPGEVVPTKEEILADKPFDYEEILAPKPKTVGVTPGSALDNHQAPDEMSGTSALLRFAVVEGDAEHAVERLHKAVLREVAQGTSESNLHDHLDVLADELIAENRPELVRAVDGVQEVLRGEAVPSYLAEPVAE